MHSNFLRVTFPCSKLHVTQHDCSSWQFNSEAQYIRLRRLSVYYIILSVLRTSQLLCSIKATRHSASTSFLESASEILLELFKVSFTKANLSQHLHRNCSHLSTDYPYWSALHVQDKGSILTYSIVQSPSWESNWFAASQEILRISRNPKFHYRTHKRPPPVSILGQPNPLHIPTSHLLEILCCAL